MRLVNHVIEWAALLALVVFAATIGLRLDDHAAMGKCQATGASFDTCHHSLNR